MKRNVEEAKAAILDYLLWVSISLCYAAMGTLDSRYDRRYLIYDR